MYWTRVRPATCLYSASPLKHHATGMQWCPNPDHYPDSEPGSRSLTPACWALSKAAEPHILTSFFLLFDAAGDQTTNLPHARRMLRHCTTRPRNPGSETRSVKVNNSLPLVAICGNYHNYHNYGSYFQIMKWVMVSLAVCWIWEARQMSSGLFLWVVHTLMLVNSQTTNSP